MPRRATTRKKALPKKAAQHRLLIFDTHPIQYRSPVFAELHKRHEHLKVYFFNPVFDAKKWWFHEVGKTPKQDFGLELEKGFPCEVLGSGRWGIVETYRRFRELLVTEKPKAILIYGYYQKEHWILRFLAQQLSIPVLFVGESFSDRSRGFRGWIREPLLKLFFAGISRFIAIGTRTLDYYEHRGISQERISLARYCTDTKLMQLSPAKAQRTRAALRKELGIPPNAFVLLFVGRLFGRKRPLDILALHKKFDENQNFHSVIVGNGEMEGELRHLAGKFPRLHMVGFQNQERIRDYYHASDLLFVPSQYETWGLVVNEAAAAGLPALITENCGVAGDLVVHERTGFIYSVGDIRTAKQIVQHVFENRPFLKATGRRVQQKVLSEYRPDQFAQSLLNTYRKVVSGF